MQVRNTAMGRARRLASALAAERREVRGHVERGHEPPMALAERAFEGEKENVHRFAPVANRAPSKWRRAENETPTVSWRPQGGKTEMRSGRVERRPLRVVPKGTTPTTARRGAAEPVSERRERLDRLVWSFAPRCVNDMERETVIALQNESVEQIALLGGLEFAEAKAEYRRRFGWVV